MGWFKRFLFGPSADGDGATEAPLRARPAVALVALAGDGEYGVEVVGESHRQDVLSEICGGPCEEGHEFYCTATLRPEPTNPHDRNAVAVDIDGRQVAYLSRDDAVEFLAEVHRLGVFGRRLECEAVINGGWDRGSRGTGSFGVELDLAWPLEWAQ